MYGGADDGGVSTHTPRISQVLTHPYGHSLTHVGLGRGQERVQPLDQRAGALRLHACHQDRDGLWALLVNCGL